MSEQDEQDPFELEPGLDSPQITPDIPATIWDKLDWKAFRKAVQGAETKKDVFDLMSGWNEDNNPKLEQKVLDEKVFWALLTFDTKFKGK